MYVSLSRLRAVLARARWRARRNGCIHTSALLPCTPALVPRWPAIALAAERTALAAELQATCLSAPCGQGGASGRLNSRGGRHTPRRSGTATATPARGSDGAGQTDRAAQRRPARRLAMALRGARRGARRCRTSGRSAEPSARAAASAAAAARARDAAGDRARRRRLQLHDAARAELHWRPRGVAHWWHAASRLRRAPHPSRVTGTARCAQYRNHRGRRRHERRAAGRAASRLPAAGSDLARGVRLPHRRRRAAARRRTVPAGPQA